jgi:hypothetical protein
MMRTGVAAIASAWLTALVVGSAQAEPLAFAGFDRSMDLATLLDRYPRSQHELTPGADVRKAGSQEDPKDWIREFFHTRGSGTYVLRLTREESFDHVYYIQANVREGVTERLWLLLETPLDMVRPRLPRRNNEARHPACNGVLKPLAAKYGKPDALAPRWEEALQSFDYVWTQLPEAMKLECGRYRGRKAVFAIGVTFEQAAAR